VNGVQVTRSGLQVYMKTPIKRSTPNLKTYDEWYYLHRQVTNGAKHVARNKDNVPLFTRKQTVDLLQPDYRPLDRYGKPIYYCAGSWY
jgi:hypothetical protein